MEVFMFERRLILFLLMLPVLAFAPSALQAQTAEELDIMLQADTVSGSQASRFVLGAADLLPEGVSGASAERAAFDMAASNGWITAAASDALTMKETAFLIMKAFDLKGGMMYTLLKNPRYAYREMIYRRFIQGQTDQNMKVTGPKLLQILDRTMGFTDD